MNVCDLCGKEYTKVDGSKGKENEDSLMINDYITMTERYKTKKLECFKIKRPNPYACRKCVKMLVEAGLREFIGGDPEKFLNVQEWWKEEITERPIKILFVCLGNVCRSSMAEKICNAYGEGKVIADSAGIHPDLPNILVDSQTIEVMKEIGIDISRHNPKHLSRVDIFAFDIIVNMSPVFARELLELYAPDFKGKMKIIDWKIVDPRRQSKEVYREVRNRLKEKVLKLIKELNAIE